MTLVPRLCVEEVTKSFGGVGAVRSFDLNVSEAEVVALVGPSGCGKTTVLRLIAGFEQPDHGRISIRGQEVAHARNGRPIPPERRRVGMVFQDYALFPHLTVRANIAYGLDRSNEYRAMWAAELVGLVDELDRFPSALSGGQQQRVAMARALAPAPDVLLLDEPFSNLDARGREHMRVEVREILKRTSTTAVFVTHDQDEALFMGDRVAVMEEGTVLQIGTPEQVFHSPATLGVADFLGETSFLGGEVVPGGIATSLGLLPQSARSSDDGRVVVLVRPDDVELVPASAGNGVVAERVFRGMHHRYRVRLDSGESVKCLSDHCVDLPAGSRVEVRIRACHALACFAGGVNVLLDN
jgi:iron(III) transport system ATP-binding protein